MASAPNFSSLRILKEVMRLRDNNSSVIRIVDDVAPIHNDSAFIAQLTVQMSGAPQTLYEGERFQLHFRFPNRYPFQSPAVTFTPDRVPIHPHVYSNGHICLSILDAPHWSPALTLESVCQSILSMLSSATSKTPPSDDRAYVLRASANPKESRWIYHDDEI